MTALYLLIFTLLAIGDTCYWNQKCPYKYFGSKTVYDDVRGDIRDVKQLKGCKPVNVWAFIRHGTRHPTSSNLPNIISSVDFKKDIVSSHLEGRGELCAQDVSNLQNWTLHEELSDSTAAYLTPEGYWELYHLGARFHERFLPLLKEIDHYNFKPTLEQRTFESAKAFLEGLGQNLLKFEQENATDVDEVLRPYYYCTKHTIEVYNGPRSKLEMDKYYQTEEFRKLLANVQNRAGFKDPLSPNNVTGLYDLCRYFRAYSKASPWCALFSNEELAMMEYLNDIRHYFRNGYGSDLNIKLGRRTAKDLYENFLRTVQGSTKSFTGYFSHDSILQMMYSALGLFRDYPGISGSQRNPNRRWRTSFFTPFAANFVAVLHDCSENATTKNYQVQFLINEQEVHLCRGRTCSWREFEEMFEPFLDSNLDFCYSPSNTTSVGKNIEVKHI